VKSNRKVLVVAAIVAGILGFGIVALFFRGSGNVAETITVNTTTPVASPSLAPQTPAATPTPAPLDIPFFGKVLEGNGASGTSAVPKNLLETFLTLTLRLTLASILAAVLAFRPRRSTAIRRNPFVAQTQILVAVVASALMMIVGDNAARAFGIFAAVSFIRFRTNIRDPKEVTVLLVSLAIGLATGVGRWDLAIILSFFVLLLLWGLEYRERELVFRAMELTVKSRNVDTTQEFLLRLFRRYKIEAEMRTLDRPDNPEDVGCVMYFVNVSPLISTDKLSEEILASDLTDIDSVGWDLQKNPSAQYYG
jgi:uncharacterized membrane protein YhiD involved in acid resistance